MTTRLLLSLFFLAAFSDLALAKGTEVRFRGTVTRIDRNSAVSGTVTLRVMTLEVPVKVNSDTEIEAGDEIGLAGLQVGDFVKVDGHFSSAGIVAEEIEVLDEFVNTFRLRGLISAVRATPSGLVITVLGVDVLMDANTQLEQRGSPGPFPVSSLAIGMSVDVRGTLQNNVLLATRVKVGPRDGDAIEVEFEGKITSLNAGRLLVDTEGGGNAVVLFNSSTEIQGTLAVGKFVEVEGILNSSLEVVAREIKVDGDDDRDADDDDDDEDDDEFEKQIRLVATSPGSAITGSAKIELESEHGTTKQEFEVEIEKAAPNTTLRIRVQIAGSGVFDFGQLVTDGDGKAKVRFRSDPSGSDRALLPLLPSGKTVVDFQRVEITNNIVVVLTGQF